MSTQTVLEKLEEELQQLNYIGDREKGIRRLRQFVSLHGESNQVLLQLAFFLYHNAFEVLNDQADSKQKKEQAVRDLAEATALCNRIIKEGADENETINARIYLAQIYAFEGLEKEAIALAKKTFQIMKNSVTANRLADIFCTLEKFNDAERWIEKYKELALSEKKLGIGFLNADLAIFYLRIGKGIDAEEYYTQAIKTLPNTPAGNSMRQVLDDHKQTKKKGA